MRESPRWPAWIDSWLPRDGRPGPMLSAYGASLLAHALIVLALVGVGYVLGDEAARTIEASVVDTALPDLERLDPTELAETDAPTTLEPVLARTAPVLSPRVVPEDARPVEVELDPAAFSPRVTLPAATNLASQVQLKGDGAEHVDGVEGAVDRLALEILRQLEKGRTHVVWAFDASGSLVAERKRLAEHIGEVYANILGRGEGRRAADEGGLLTTVVGFGQERRILTPEPTAEPGEIKAAIESVYLDESGVENTFQMVAEVARRFGGRFEVRDVPFRTMLIVVTDEVGEDEQAVELAIAAAGSAEMPVFVLGSPALFGQSQGYMEYTDPKTGQYYPRLAVTQGPESVELEQIRLPFWYDGPQYEELDAGFGPYALSRLAGATGGIYFVTRMGDNRASFDPKGMREYRPDWVSRDQYHLAATRDPVREAVLLASRITQQNLPGQPSLYFPAAGTPEFKEAMDRNQEVVARVLYTVEEALVPISQAADARPRETSRRWQAHYDLVRARLLAMKLRCYEYNWACAQMKTSPRPFQDPKSNAWRMVPDEQIHYSEKAAEAGLEAAELLRRVAEDHAGTPWELLARREAKDPFGFRWVETYVPPPPPRDDSPAAEARRKKAQPKGTGQPPAVPKL